VIKRQYICSRENGTGNKVTNYMVKSDDAVARYHKIHVRYSIDILKTMSI
jgi:hypothetical protein